MMTDTNSAYMQMIRRQYEESKKRGVSPFARSDGEDSIRRAKKEYCRERRKRIIRECPWEEKMMPFRLRRGSKSRCHIYVSREIHYYNPRCLWDILETQNIIEFYNATT